jgi:hydroxymethylglutaryl-CoA reductase
MGANLVNSICEKATPDVIEMIGGTPGIRILSNYCTERLTVVKAEIPVEKVGREIAERMVLANEFAMSDVYRATTHNKGVMNGVDAVSLATG